MGTLLHAGCPAPGFEWTAAATPLLVQIHVPHLEVLRLDDIAAHPGSVCTSRQQHLHHAARLALCTAHIRPAASIGMVHDQECY
jgi:hypothetical protein